MPGYSPRVVTVEVGGPADRRRVLGDLQQCGYADAHGHGPGPQLAIPSLRWSLSGRPWPSRRLPALAMEQVQVAGRRLLGVLTCDPCRRPPADRLPVAQELHGSREGIEIDTSALPPGRAPHSRRALGRLQ